MDILRTISPVDGSVYVERQLASSAEIAATLQRAHDAGKHWQSLPLTVRQAICEKAVDCFLANRSAIAEEITWMMGRPISQAAGEIAGFEERARHMISIADTALAPVLLPEKRSFRRYIKRVPLGTVFVIAPWNYPYLTSVNSIIPALLAGNTVVLKHSAQTPLCAERLYQAFKQAGIPDNVFQYLHLSHADTESVIRSPQVNYVAFTGSVAGGQMVEKAAAGRFIGVGLELGGKDPAYIRADADIEKSVETVIDGAFFNSGQSCCGIERLYVDKKIYQDVVEQSVELLYQYRLGRPDDPDTTLGPMVKTRAANFIREQVADATGRGATAHIKEHRFHHSKSDTPYLAPQLLTGVNHTMRVMTEESFGPVLGIQPVNDDEEAISLMNDSEFGLTAAIFTRDDAHGEMLSDQLETGTVFVNRCDYLDPALAWTGVKNSGRGCTLSTIGFDMLTRPKSFHFKHS